MKRILLILMALATMAATTAQKSTLDCTFHGTDGTTRIVVNEARGGKLVPTDTLMLDTKGHIKLQRNLKEPLMMALSLTMPQSPMVHVLLLPKEKVTLAIDFMPTINFLNITSAKGSKNMTLYKSYTNLATELMLSQQSDQMADRLEKLLDENPGVLMSAFLVTFYEKAYEQYAPLYKKIRDALIDKWPNNEFVQHIDSRVRTSLVAGMEAPDIALPDRDGNIRKLSDLRGKVVLIDFWASWCRPCRMENPNVVKLYRQYHDRGFEVFSVSLDNNREAWLKAIVDDHLDWSNHVSDLRGWASAGGKLYGIQSIPATVLVDSEGKIVARNLRGAELENKLKALFAE